MNVYDFDETVYRGECSLEFFLYYLRKDFSLIKYIPGVFRALILYKQEKISLDSFLTDYGKEVGKYMAAHSAELNSAVKSFWDKREKHINSFYFLQQREDDVIITASPDFLMEEICRRIGVKNLISTHIDPHTGKIEKPCFREAKIERFREVYPTQKIDDFYTDSMNDRFLMPLAEHVFIVKGKRIKQVK